VCISVTRKNRGSSTYPTKLIQVPADADVNLDVLLFLLAALSRNIPTITTSNKMIEFLGPPDSKIRGCSCRGYDGVLGVEEMFDLLYQIAGVRRAILGLVSRVLVREGEAPLQGNEDVHIAVVCLLGSLDRRCHVDK
jgi:hypothetical protein